jgi:hypothetical protein
MKKMLLVSVALAASLSIAGCNRAATTNAAAPANKAAPANTAAPAGNSAGGGNAAGGGGASAQQNFTFVNQSGQTVTTLQVSPTGESSWGADILGRDVLANGESADITFERGDDRCFWDVRATGEGGGELVMMNQNLCEMTSITALPAQ